MFATQPIEQEKMSKTPLTPAHALQGLKTLGEPSLAERRLHELTNLPYRDWCKAKGRYGFSTKQIDVIQIDYCFHSTHKDLPLQKILSACDVQTGMD